MSQESIQDIFGQDIYPGHLIAVCRQTGSEHELSIVLGFKKGLSRYGKQTYNLIVYKHSWYGSSSFKSHVVVRPGFNNTIIVLDPSSAFLALDNKKIKNIFESIDKAKDKKFLPQDYKIGKHFSEEQNIQSIID